MELILKNFETVLNEYKDKLKLMYQDKIANEVYKNDFKRFASGNLISTVQTSIQRNGMTYSVIFDAIGYWQFIENGTKTHYSKGEFPHNSFNYSGNGTLSDNILKWIQVKPILPREIDGKLPTEKQLTYLISRKIRTEGIEGNHPLERTVNDLNQEYLPKLQEALQEDFDVSVFKYVTEIFPNYFNT